MTKRNPPPSYERVRELFDYEPDTGILRWKVKRANKEIGDQAGALRDSGYLVVGVDYKLYRVHRIIWLWMTGDEPKAFLDHRDMVQPARGHEIAEPSQYRLNQKKHNRAQRSVLVQGIRVLGCSNLERWQFIFRRLFRFSR